MRGPCAKKVVKCYLYDRFGFMVAEGENDCAEPQKVCPRQPNEDYLKCRIVCKQDGHAEQVALMKAGGRAKGCRAVVVGIDNVCKSCQTALFGAGVVSITIWNPNG